MNQYAIGEDIYRSLSNVQLAKEYIEDEPICNWRKSISESISK